MDTLLHEAYHAWNVGMNDAIVWHSGLQPFDLAPGLLMPLRNQLCFFDEGAGAVLAGACVSGPRFFDGLAKSSG